MTLLKLSDSLEKSYIQSDSYPANFSRGSIHKYPTELREAKARLDAVTLDLFVERDSEADVSFRDLDTVMEDGSRKTVRKTNAQSEDKLIQFLGIHTTIDANSQRRTVGLQRRDPKCRFIYIWGIHSRAPLQITRSMLGKIFTYHQVMPSYLDFISVFGHQSQRIEPRDLRFSGFRTQITIAPNIPCAPAMSIGRSGRQYQMSYNLKRVTLMDNDPLCETRKDWSIRQAAIHHQFDIVEGTTLWIVTKGHTDLQQQFKELTGPDGRPEDKSFGTLEECFRSSLAVHLLFAHWSMQDWRGYIRHLEDVVEGSTTMAIYGVREEGHAYQIYEAKDIQKLQLWEDRTNEAIMVLEGNVTVLESIRKFYGSLENNKHFPGLLKEKCADDLLLFLTQTKDMIDDFNMQTSRARLLIKVCNDRKELVSQHLQSQSTNRIQRLNENMEKEAIVMRIITTVTLIYLPATFVSTFFSTDIIKYQDQSGGLPGPGTFSKVALERWLQVTIPLTALTLVIAWSWRRSAEKQRTEGHEWSISKPQKSVTVSMKELYDKVQIPWPRSSLLPIFEMRRLSKISETE